MAYMQVTSNSRSVEGVTPPPPSPTLARDVQEQRVTSIGIEVRRHASRIVDELAVDELARRRGHVGAATHSCSVSDEQRPALGRPSKTRRMKVGESMSHADKARVFTDRSIVKLLFSPVSRAPPRSAAELLESMQPSAHK